MGYVSWKPNARGMSVARARIRPAMVCDGEQRLKLALGLLADGVCRESGPGSCRLVSLILWLLNRLSHSGCPLLRVSMYCDSLDDTRSTCFSPRLNNIDRYRLMAHENQLLYCLIPGCSLRRRNIHCVAYPSAGFTSTPELALGPRGYTCFAYPSSSLPT